MDLLIVLVKTLFFYWIIVLVYRFMGKREVGELSIVDLIVSILIAELAAMSIEQYNKSIFLSLIPMIVLVLLQIVLAKLSLKHPKLRTLLDGEPSLIIEKGKVKYKLIKVVSVTKAKDNKDLKKVVAKIKTTSKPDKDDDDDDSIWEKEKSYKTVSETYASFYIYKGKIIDSSLDYIY